METAERNLRGLARICVALGACFAATFVAAAFLARFRVPYRDDWDWIAWRLDGPITLRRLLIPHNEHLIPLPRLILAAQFSLEKSRNDLMFAACLGALLGTSALVLNEARKHPWPSNADRLIAIGAGLALLLFNWQLQSVVFVTSIVTSRGNFRVLEGIWESAGFFLAQT